MEKESLGGTWGLALFMIVLASWIFYRYLSPKSWREWKSAGLVHAFIIALYAEMYGFPLTIYLLSAVFKIDIPWVHANGHLWSFFIKEGTTAAMIEMFLGFAVIFSGIYLIAVAWQRVYAASREKRLVTDGPYSIIRHPQYTGIFLVVVGQLIHWPTLITLILSPMIFFVYYRLARKEERDMLAIFGEGYHRYMEHVPMFFPRLDDLKSIWLQREEAA